MFVLKAVSFTVLFLGTTFQVAHAFFRVGLDPVSAMLCTVNAACILHLALAYEKQPPPTTTV
jgi:hypothetical protein